VAVASSVASLDATRCEQALVRQVVVSIPFDHRFAWHITICLGLNGHHHNRHRYHGREAIAFTKWPQGPQSQESQESKSAQSHHHNRHHKHGRDHHQSQSQRNTACIGFATVCSGVCSVWRTRRPSARWCAHRRQQSIVDAPAARPVRTWAPQGSSVRGVHTEFRSQFPKESLYSGSRRGFGRGCQGGQKPP
jgi:hypothetical protein